MNKKTSLSYLITVSKKHLLPSLFLLQSLREKTKRKIFVVGNLEKNQIELIKSNKINYIDEDEIDLSNRLPKFEQEEKYRDFGWYKQMFIRLSSDRFINTEQVVILDSEVFLFKNWDEKNFYEQTGQPRCFYWTPKKRKPDWDYKMYKGAAYLLQFLPECKNIMSYANSDSFKRHITGVALFSTANLAHLWNRLEKETDLKKNINHLFNNEPELAFSDHDMYGLGVDCGLFDKIVPTTLHNNLLGWYEGHDDEVFHKFKKNATWSICQQYQKYPSAELYFNYMKKISRILNQTLVKTDYKKIDKKMKKLGNSKTKRLYQDSAETFLLNLFKDKSESQLWQEISKLLNQNPGWDLYYNLHPQRRHILDWYKFEKNASLLDVGAGTGAVTGLFLEKLKKVTALELSSQRANILKLRFKNHKNLNVISSSIYDYNPKDQFDYLNVTGVLEYAATFKNDGKINFAKAHYTFLKKCHQFLKKRGRLLLAIENPLGTRYFSGAVEDHCGELFEGVENYPQHDSIRTYTKNELTKALIDTGFDNVEFYLLYPDYKLPIMVINEKYLMKHSQFSLASFIANFDKAHPLYNIFSEVLFSYQIKKEGLLANFANSFLVVAQKK